MNSISEATAYIKGNSGIYGEVNFYQKDGAVLVEAHITGLPADNATGFFAFHIHEGKSCGGTAFSAVALSPCRNRIVDQSAGRSSVCIDGFLPIQRYAGREVLCSLVSMQDFGTAGALL